MPKTPDMTFDPCGSYWNRTNLSSFRPVLKPMIYFLLFILGRSRNKDKCMFLLYIHANSVSNTKGGKKCADSQSSGVAMEFSMKDLYAVEEIHSQKNLFKLLVG